MAYELEIKNWIMPSQEFIVHSKRNKTGINAGQRMVSITGKNTRAQKKHVKPQFRKFVASDCLQILHDGLDGLSPRD